MMLKGIFTLNSYRIEEVFRITIFMESANRLEMITILKEFMKII